MNVTVREFVESDREALRELFLAARKKAFSWALSSEFKPEDFDSSTKDERILVAVQGSRQVGFASIWEADSFLHNLFVHPEYQRSSVGKTLLDWCEKYFSGIPTLKCVKANDHARQFYQSQGWSVRNEAEGPEGAYLLMERVRPNKVTNYAPSAQDAAGAAPVVNGVKQPRARRTHDDKHQLAAVPPLRGGTRLRRDEEIP